ncbi:FAD dependent oxidoreductase [Aureococcus anophagefferens]|nr:FAD dependent oxidoreductase [Aureococcus anophagefferens]
MCSRAALVAALPTLLAAFSARRAPFSARRAPRQRTLMSAALRGAPPSSRVVILGGGLQGCAAAYYLKERGFDDVTVVERTAVAAAASGKGGGFLERGWGSGPTKALHERSFDLHEELAGDLGLASYRKIKTMEVTGELGLREWPPVAKATEKPKNVGAPKWLDDEDTGARLMDPNTAQVVPRELCEKLFERSGATLVVGAARGLETADAGGDARVTGVSVEDGAGATTTVPCDVLVCAMGVWSVLLEDWLGAGQDKRAKFPTSKAPFSAVFHSFRLIFGRAIISRNGLEASSVVFAGDDAVKAEPVALFCAEDSNSCHLEVYPRVDGSVYMCGIGGSDYVRGDRLREGGDLQDATKMRANPDRVAAAVASFSGLAPFARGKDPELTQACMRPCAPDALPLLGVVPGTSNVVLAAGHNCWGILWAPITGKLVAELVADGAVSSAPIDAFAPGRFMARKAKRGRAQGELRVGEQW